MIHDTYTIDGVVYEVVFDGRQELLPERPSKASDTWESPNRTYTRTGLHTNAVKIEKRLQTDLWLKSLGLDKPEKEVQSVPLTDEQLDLLEDTTNPAMEKS